MTARYRYIGLAAASAIICVQSVTAAPEPAAAPASRCVAIDGGVEYRAYLPDQTRYVYVSVKSLSGYYPSVFVTVDKNFEAKPNKPLKDEPLNAWWIDRSRPMTFSTDKVAIRWAEGSSWISPGSWFSSSKMQELDQPIRGLAPSGGQFSGTGSLDTNSFAFQTRLEVTNSEADAFEVALPTVSYEGATVAPPVVHFLRDGNTVSAKC